MGTPCARGPGSVSTSAWSSPGTLIPCPSQTMFPVASRSATGPGPVGSVGRSTCLVAALRTLALACETGDAIRGGDETALSVDVTWIFYDHEEVASHLNGLGRVQCNHPEWLAGDLALLGEPTAAHVEGGCNGTLRVIARSWDAPPTRRARGWA